VVTATDRSAAAREDADPEVDMPEDEASEDPKGDDAGPEKSEEIIRGQASMMLNRRLHERNRHHRNLTAGFTMMARSMNGPSRPTFSRVSGDHALSHAKPGSGSRILDEGSGPGRYALT
jgi:hypothetical protein